MMKESRFFHWAYLPTLPKLKFISLNYHQISEISSGLFSYNVNLEQIQLYGNKIKFIGSGLFNGLTKLNIVDLRMNICEVNQKSQGNNKINELEKEFEKQIEVNN